MCHGDLSLQKPHADENTQVLSGFGNVHLCRDWSTVHQAVMAKRIARLKNGKWVDTSIRERL